jgi:hypothetical protein
MASIFTSNNKSSKQSKIGTTVSTLSEHEKAIAVTKLTNSLNNFPKEKKVQDALNLSKQVGNFIYERKNGVPDKIAENKGNALITNILIGIAEAKPSREIVADLRRLSGWQ